MAQRIPNLWSEKDVKVEVLSPIAILRTQAENLEQMTQGLIETEITVVTSDKGETIYQLDVIAPVLGGYRHRLLAISHQKDTVYPVNFVMASDEILKITGIYRHGVGLVAQTEAEFLKNLGVILQSPTINALIQSIIARSNEIQDAPAEAVA